MKLNTISHRPWNALKALLALSCSAPFSLQAQVTFTAINPPSGKTSITVEGLSSDGQTAVGVSASHYPDDSIAVAWTSGGGTKDLGTIASSPAIAFAANPSGSVIVGASNLGAMVWNVGGGIQVISSGGYAKALSTDGSVVAGQVGGSAFRYTSETGVTLLQGLNGTSTATGISGNGSIVVGSATQTGLTSDSEAFRWTAETGMIRLGNLPGASGTFSMANAITRDGSVIVGTTDSGAGQQAFSFTTGAGMQSLGVISNAITTAIAVSDDGSLIGGYAQVGGVQDYRAWLWDADHGIRYVADILAADGVNTIGYSLVNVVGISADGRTVLGQGVGPDGQSVGWVVEFSAVPEPSSYAALAGCLVFVGVVARKRWKADASRNL